jgi:hypothetical protein
MRKLHELRPWARTPDARPVIEALGLRCDLVSPVLFSKAAHADLLRAVLRSSANPILCPVEMVGTVATAVEEVTNWLADAPRARCVLKAPFSTAGRNRLIRTAAEPLTRKEKAWIDATVQAQGAVVIEPWLERLVDFSVQYECRMDSGRRRRGLVILANSREGQFRSATVATRFTDFLDEETRRVLFAGASRRGHLIEFLDDTLEPFLRAWLEAERYAGPLGVDAFFYREAAGMVRCKPVVEINPRYTMGRVAIELARFTPPNARTTLTIGKAGAMPKGAVQLTPDMPGARFAAHLSVE